MGTGYGCIVMREIIKHFIRICADTLPISEPIYEFGSFQVPGQEGFADLRPFFKGMQYVGADTRKGPGVDVVLNLHSINLPSESVGTVLVLDTLEHVEFPRRALSELFRILKSGGVLIISSVMDFPIHDYPYDYWRFTPEGFKSLLGDFPKSFVGYSGADNFPDTVIGVGFKDSNTSFDLFLPKYACWKDHWTPKLVTWRKIANSFIPPKLSDVYSRILTKKQYSKRITQN